MWSYLCFEIVAFFGSDLDQDDHNYNDTVKRC